MILFHREGIFWVNLIDFNLMGPKFVIFMIKFWLLKKLPKFNTSIKSLVFNQFWWHFDKESCQAYIITTQNFSQFGFLVLETLIDSCVVLIKKSPCIINYLSIICIFYNYLLYLSIIYFNVIVISWKFFPRE